MKFNPNEPPKAPTVSQVVKKLKSIDKGRKELEEYQHPHRTAAIKHSKNLVNKISSALNKKLSNKAVLKSQNKVTVVENQPVYSKDKSRFFKEAWKEEKRQLFFK